MPQSEAYPKALKTIADHLRKRRIDLKLFQKDVAALIGVDVNTITNWEVGRSRPRLMFVPQVLKFLGYDPWRRNETTPANRIKAFRQGLGLSQRRFARQLGIDPTTLARWEKGKRLPSSKMKRTLGEYLKRLS